MIGHSDAAPLRKTDPGELFDWPRLAAEGLARLVPTPQNVVLDASAARERLAKLGYGFLDEDSGAVIAAFQRRFRPAEVTGRLDAETAGLLAALTTA